MMPLHFTEAIARTLSGPLKDLLRGRLSRLQDWLYTGNPARLNEKSVPPIKVFRDALLLAFCTALTAGCATAPQLFPGDPEQAVLAKIGQPAARYRVGDEQWLEYPTGPFGQRTWFAHIGNDGKLKLWEQVLTTQKFATITVDKANKEDVLRTIGHPTETSYLALPDLEVWSYRYKEADVWDSMMHVHFDKQGIVRKMQNGPDPAYDREGGGRRGFRR